MTEGTLFVKVKKNRNRNIKKNIQLIFFNSRGEYSTKNLNQIPPEQISLALTEKLTENTKQEITVEFEEEGDQLQKIREKGTEWDRQEAKPVKPVELKDKEIQPFARKSTSQTNKNIVGKFHNPYNFIPALSRKHLEDYPEGDIRKELGDDLPKGHGCYHQNYWSGRISVTLKTVTPLLIPDAANATEDKNNHKTYPLRIDSEGKPYLPSTSVKGMLRSAYEAVTNSRLSIFEKHQARLAYRSLAKAKPEIFPARVEKKDGALCLRIMEESGLVGYTAKLPRYDKKSNRKDKGESRAALKYEGTNIKPSHGDLVWVKLDAKGKVTEIRQENKPPKSLFDWKTGWVCITGANINGKMNERVFIDNPDNEFIPVTDEHISLWKELINNYQEIHQKELKQREDKKQSPQDYLGSNPGDTAWSRHIWHQESIDFNEGTLCYVELDNNSEVLAIQPVTISRRLYEKSPHELLDKSLKPASCINRLSPADRVFGWVKQNKGQSKNQKGATSYKGNLRIFNVNCQADDGIEYFGDTGFPLTILGEPKEQQARFYQAEDKHGNPIDNSRKQEAYSDVAQGLRGRKVYPHHNGLPDKYWSEPQKYRSEDINGYYQEYRQPSGEKEKTDQNRSIKAWVKPNVEFFFTVDIINLSPVELGALLWLLTLEDNYYYRLGGGKPLGFGSVQLNINWDNTDLRKGEDWQKYYQSLFPINKPDAQEAQTCMEGFKTALEQAYGNGTTFEDVSFIKAFRTAAKGFDDKLPIHYPRTTKERHPKGEGFDWFVDNERVGQGLKLSLPSLAEDTGLPFNPCQNQSNNSTNNRR